MLLATLLVLGVATPVRAADPYNLGPGDLIQITVYAGGEKQVDFTGYVSALGTITSQFQEKESRFWNSSLQITAYGAIHETAFRPWQSDNIPRRFCSADVMLSDGKQRTVHYSIIEDGGFAGFGQGVEWCVTGLDRNWAYNPGCKAARP